MRLPADPNTSPTNSMFTLEGYRIYSADVLDMALVGLRETLALIS